MSSTFSPAETLRQHRPLLLAMEAIGWFHMAGKARIEFLRRHGGENNGYDERHWHDLETPPFPWDTLLEWVKRLYGSGIPNNAWPGSFSTFIEQHAGRNPGLLGLLQAGHGIVSGVEKNLPTSTSDYLKQTIPHMWLSSPWGHPKRNLLANPPELLTPQGWQQLVGEIRRVLEELRDLGTRGVSDVAHWQDWRNRAIGEKSFVRRAFMSTLAETRLPNNDVTLWDQSYVAAALFKSAVAGALLDKGFPWNWKSIATKLGINLRTKKGKEKSFDDLSKDEKLAINNFTKSNTRWRLLTIALGTEHYEARAVKIGDWTGAQGAIDEFFRRVAELVEVDIAAGSLLYRDSSMAVFSFPGERFDEEEQERQRRRDPNFEFDEENFASRLRGWNGWLQDQVEEIARNLELETPPFVRLSKPTRSLVPIVRELKESKLVVAVPVHKQWDVHWRAPSETRGHVCPVCRVRLNGDPTNKGKPCAVCRERRHHRRDAWLQGQLDYDTIWFEEVADRNGRLALLTFSLDLEDWLNGSRVDSLRVQAIPEWVRFNLVLSGQPNPIAPTGSMDKLIDELKQRFRDPQNPQHFKFDKNDQLLANLQEGYKYENDWPTFFRKIVEDRTDAPTWGILNDDQRAAWLAHQLFRKLPSPGRVYRFWREAEEFFHDLLKEFRQIAARSENCWRVRRLVLVPDDNNDWRDLTLYNGRWEGRQISLVYVRSLGGFVTASNLGRLLRPEEQSSSFQGAQIRLEEEDTFGQERPMTVTHVNELRQPHAHLSLYHPVIPVEVSPLRFRVLVPLEAASECVDIAVSWWKEHFSRVWDRLPLRIGVVAFPRMLPYQAVIGATRKMEEELKGEEETWQVEEVERQAGVVVLRLKLEDGKSILKIVPTAMPDGRDDVFYPYMVIEDRQLRFPRDFRHPKDGRVYRHVSDLRPGDGVKVSTARVTILFMGSTSARFSNPDLHYLEDWEQMREIWNLLKKVVPSQTALQRFRTELGRLEKEWQTPEGQRAVSKDLWEDTLRAMLVHHLEVRGTALETLIDSAQQRLLQWAIDWHTIVLKENV